MTISADLADELVASVLPIIGEYRAGARRMKARSKIDSTVLTEADLEVQAAIVSVLRQADPKAAIVAEEWRADDRPLDVAGARPIWVIDPIDGTAQFVRPAMNEFCSVVALVEAGVPTACWILAPELANHDGPLEFLVTGPESGPLVNRQPARVFGARTQSPEASATQSASVASAALWKAIESSGVTVKRSATSQTLDQVRTCLDLSADTGLTSFEWFSRRAQKAWDGVAGQVIAGATGRVTTDWNGDRLAPINRATWDSPEPNFPSVIVARAEEIGAVVDLHRPFLETKV